MPDFDEVIGNAAELSRAFRARKKACDALYAFETAYTRQKYQLSDILVLQRKRNSLTLKRNRIEISLGENDVAEAELRTEVDELVQILNYLAGKLEDTYQQEAAFIENGVATFENIASCNSNEAYICRANYAAAITELKECGALGEEMRLQIQQYDREITALDDKLAAARSHDDGPTVDLVVDIDVSAKRFLEAGSLATNDKSDEAQLISALGKKEDAALGIFRAAATEQRIEQIFASCVHVVNDAMGMSCSTIEQACSALLGREQAFHRTFDVAHAYYILLAFRAEDYLDAFALAVQDCSAKKQSCDYVGSGLFNRIYNKQSSHICNRDDVESADDHRQIYMACRYFRGSDQAYDPNADSVFRQRQFRILDSVAIQPNLETERFPLRVLPAVRSTDKEYISQLFTYLQKQTPVVHFFKTSFTAGTLRLSGDYSSMFIKTQQMRYCYGIGRFTGFGTNFFDGMDRKKSLLVCFEGSGKLCLQFCTYFSCDAWATGIKQIKRVWKQMPGIRSLLGAIRGKDEEG